MSATNEKMKHLPGIFLHKGRDESLRRRHPWVFSGAIRTSSVKLEEGDVAEFFDANDEFLGIGLVETGSIAAKIISFERKEINHNFWVEKLRNAFNLRKAAGLSDNPQTNAWRLVFAEGDGMPGLVLDYYDGLVVFLAQSVGMYQLRMSIVEALKNVLGNELKAVYDKSTSFRDQTKDNNKSYFLFGKTDDPVTIKENGHSFLVDFIKGQKTGFFIDQRENRALAGQYATGKKVLNLFSYTGGFSVYALKNGASEVYSVDSSAYAIQMAKNNVELNNIPAEKHAGIVADVKDYIKTMPEDFDLIILDPPAFAKHKETRHKALQGYKFLNLSVMKRIASGGILFTFSCSQVVSFEMFESMIMAAAIECGRNIRIIHRLGQPADHPVSVFHPEGSYLKGLVLFVE